MKIIFAVLSYLLGAVPSGFLIFRLSEKKDIRGFGSQSTGATNVLRLKGWAYAVPVMLIDVLKGALPVFLSLQIFEDRRFAMLCGFLAILGHCFPVYIKFKGGKGVATMVGAFAVLSLPSLLSVIGVFVAVLILTRYVSLGSLLASLCLIPAAYLFTGELDIVILSAAVFSLVLFRHWGNIQRLTAGTERKFGQREK